MSKEEAPKEEVSEKAKPWIYIDLNTQKVFIDFFHTIIPTEDLVPLTWKSFLEAWKREK